MRRFVGSAAYRIAFAYSSGLALAILLLGVIVYFAADADFRRQQDIGIATESATLVRAFQQEGIGELREELTAREVGNAINSFGYALFDTHGRRIAGSLDTPQPPAGWHNITFLDPREGPDPARAFARDLPGGLRLVVAADSEAVERIDGTILALFGGAFLLVILIGVVGALILGGYLRSRLGRISGTAQAIVSGHIDQRVPVGPRRDEFDQLSLALNAMLDRIARLLDNLRQVSSDVAHDLRTPLARLRNQLEEAVADPRGGRAHTAALERAIEQSDALLALFAAILRISEIEAGSLAAIFQPVDLSHLAADLAESYAPAIADGGRTLVMAIAPGIVVQGDREQIAQAVINLLDNAQHHAPPGTQIALELGTRSGNVYLTVADDGPGVPAADRERIVQRFTRLEASRTTPGHGLGLNLVSAIALAHGAALQIGDNYPGLRVSIAFPSDAA